MERLARFCELLRDTFPARSELASLEFVDAALRDERAVIVTIRLVGWDRGEDGTLSIRDVKEQDVFVGEVEVLAHPLLGACVTGSIMALDQLFAQDDLTWVETVMPADLLHPFGALLRLKRPRTAEDFGEALLASRQRLGQFLRG
jgi:hypothetical protein